ncbi:sensor domain-containing diguanylate cyclase [Sulfurimonas sp.]|uniref:sensor domain-containing diguanylate cyclase n=1 Tax=Sulfurimonas sp. TaxID=2022749 RepID=UPI003D115BEF
MTLQNENKLLKEKLKSAEKINELFYFFLENSSDFIYFKDKNYNFTFTSNKFSNLLNFKGWKELIGKNDFDVFDEEHAKMYRKADKSVLEKANELISHEETYYDKNGELCWITTSKKMIHDKNNKVVGLFGISRDITELKRSNEKLNFASRIAQIGFWEFDGNTESIKWTDTIYDIFEVEDKNIKIDYKKFLSYLPKEEQKFLTATFYRSIENKEEYHCIHSIITKKNNIKYAEERGKHFYDKKGKYIKTIGSIYDITAQYIIEKNLLAQKEEFKTIFDISLDGIIIVNFEADILFFNETFLKMTGYNDDELLGKSLFDITLNEDINLLKESLSKARQKGYFEYLEERLITKNNKKIIANISVALMPDKQRFLVTIKNISSIKKHDMFISEYIKIVDNNVITSSTDLNGTITYSSEAFCTISGYTKEELIGEQHNIVRHPDTDKKTFEEIWDSLEKDKVWKGELKNRKKDGGFYWVSISISPIYNEFHKKIGYTAIRHDITDKKIIEELSILDPLTEIYNRRHFKKVVPDLINIAKRKNELITFLMIDIDYFKLYNDTYGHEKGDMVLTKVAKVMKNTLKRADDYCFRLGGEEFAIVYKTKTKEQSIQLAELIKDNVSKLEIKHKKSEKGKLSISIGLICKNAVYIKSVDDLYKEADKLLYIGKANGRDILVTNLS